MSISLPSLQLLGAGCFGMLIGWYIYYINRHRKDDAQLSDLVTLVGVIGGATILTIFPSGTDLFGAYGVGLAVGFFGYFIVLFILVWISTNFNVDYFIDGRRKNPDNTESFPPIGESHDGALLNYPGPK